MYNEFKEMNKERIDRILEVTKKLSCPLQHNSENGPCPAMKRLASKLSEYQQWIKQIRQSKDKLQTPSLTDTTEVDISILDNKKFGELVIESAKNVKKIKEKQLTELQSLLKENKLNIQIFATFTSPAQFRKAFLKKTSIKAGDLNRLYREILPKCRKEAQEQGLPGFISDVDIQ